MSGGKRDYEKRIIQPYHAYDVEAPFILFLVYSSPIFTVIDCQRRIARISKPANFGWMVSYRCPEVRWHSLDLGV